MSEQPAMSVGRPLTIVPIYLILAVGLIVLTVSPLNPGGPDDGLLHLAGATALLSDGDYPIVQRPPLYSGVLAVIAYVTGTDTAQTQPLAQELGNINHLDVATAMLDDGFLRALLIVNLLFWSLTVLLVTLILHDFAIPWWGIGITLILMSSPSSWAAIGLVSETPLASFLLALGVFMLSRAIVYRPTVASLLLAGAAFALAAMTRAAFQLLPPVLLILLIVVLRRRYVPSKLAFHALVFILPFILIVGSWSVRNFSIHGFWGTSGVTGVALSTRTARIVDRGADAYPVETAEFVRLRDETYLAESNKDDVIYWGARAANWLMAERDLTYNEANELLFDFNLAAIRSGSLTYLDTVLTSLVRFHYPGVDDTWSPVPRLLWSVGEFAIIALFLSSVGLWIAAHLLARLGFFAPRWRPVDKVIAIGLVIYVYTALVASVIDIGKPQQRFPVHFLVPLLIVLSAQIGALKSPTRTAG